MSQPGIFTDVYEIYQGQDWSDFAAFYIGTTATADDLLDVSQTLGRHVVSATVTLEAPAGATDRITQTFVSDGSRVAITDTEVVWNIPAAVMSTVAVGTYKFRITLVWSDGTTEIPLTGPARVAIS